MTEHLNLVFFGIVGSGKGTQAKLLRDYLGNTEYIGTGEIFRKIMQSREDDNEAKKIAKELLNAGKLMPDDITNQLVWDALAKITSLESKNLIFDGYPRTIAQSEYFLKLMEKYNREPVKIIFIALSEAQALQRNLLRGRHDDTEEGLRQRFDEYNNKVIPAMAYLKDRPGYQIYTINGEQTVAEVHKEIIAKLGV